MNVALSFVVPIPQAVLTSSTTWYNGKSQQAAKTMTNAVMSETNTTPGLGLSVSALTGGLCTCACAYVCVPVHQEKPRCVLNLDVRAYQPMS